MNGQRQGRAVAVAAIALATLVSGAPSGASRVLAAADPPDMVADWNEYALVAIGGPQVATPPVAGAAPAAGLGQPPPIAPVHLAIVHGAIYDAVIAIDGGYEPYLPGLQADGTESQAAAAATAAYNVLLGLVADSPLAGLTAESAANVRGNVEAYLDSRYAASLDAIADGDAKTDGIEVGEAAAASMLVERADDGRFGSHMFTPGSGIGEWRPLPTANVFAWIKNVEPFTLTAASQLRTPGPLNIRSARYAAEFNEVKSLGRQTGSSRSAAQTELANFGSANPVPMINSAFRTLAAGLSTTDQARLFVRTSMTSADALIACWDDKDYWSFWRPETAIENAGDDGNPKTEAEANWTSLLVVPPGYPDHPSGYNCFTSAMMNSARAFFGTDHTSFTLTSPGGLGIGAPAPRHYTRFSAVIDDAIDARVYLGIHFRTPDVQGAWIGKKAAEWVVANFFAPTD